MESMQPPRKRRAEQHATDNALLSLPDDALLAVLAYLSPRELFNCRVVSRRLRDMCLHPALWKNVKLVKRGMIRAALALAPCLASISSGYPSEVSLKVLASQVLSTDCVVDELLCWVDVNDDIPFAVSICLKLSALGGLRGLELGFGYFEGGDKPFLLKAVCNLSNLQSLKVDVLRHEPLPASCCDFEVRPSLTHLVYSSSRNDPFLELLLRTHAATLQRVELECIKDTPVALLAKIHGLRYLRCRLSNDLIQLVAMPNLRELKLYVADSEGDPTAFPQGATDFLSLASKLQRVEFLVTAGSVQSSYLLALLSRSPAAVILETLVVSSIGAVEVVQLIVADFVQLLTSVPAKFPSLRYLSLDAVPSDELLRAVSPTSLPCLTTLDVRAPNDTCLHTWLHYPAVQDLLVRNTALHLRVQWFKTTLQECSCPWCRWGCHSLLKGPRYGRAFSFSSHSRRAGCPVNCFQVVHPLIF